MSLGQKPREANPRGVRLVTHIQSNQKRRQRFHVAGYSDRNSDDQRVRGQAAWKRLRANIRC